MSKKEFNFQLPQISQVGVVVHDVDKTAEYYTKLGIGPFDVLEVKMDGFTYKGKPAPHKVKFGFSRGTPQIELIESIEGETPNSDFLKERGEGISHFQFKVDMDEYNAILAEWAKEGVEPIFYRNDPETSIAYLNTDRIGGVMIELIGVKEKG
jgi:methylmalonyl-CoA/ethylmalonyl-CoA epimerase